MNKSVLAIVIAATLLISLVGMASAAPIVFYLDSTTDSGGSGQYLMWKNDFTECSGSVPISGSGSVIWTANDPAAYDIGFPAGKKWNVNIARTDEGERKWTAYVGYYDGTFHPYGNSGEITISSVDFSSTSGPFETTAFTVPEGKWLALRVGSSTGINVETLGGITSSWEYYTPPPDYPVPELCTVGLFGIGLVTLMGYVGYRRRTTK